VKAEGDCFRSWRLVDGGALPYLWQDGRGTVPLARILNREKKAAVLQDAISICVCDVSVRISSHVFKHILLGA